MKIPQKAWEAVTYLALFLLLVVLFLAGVAGVIFFFKLIFTLTLGGIA